VRDDPHVNEHLSRIGAALLGGAVVFAAAGATSALTASGGWSNPVVIALLIAAALCLVAALWALAARTAPDHVGAGRVPPEDQAHESTPHSGSVVSFGDAWGRMTLPIRARVGVIDSSDALELGLSAMQLDNIGHTGRYDAVVVSFVNTRIRAHIYNAFGMQAMEGAEVRISSAFAKHLDCNVGDEILIEGLAVMSG
jgi:hypothetical protein